MHPKWMALFEWRYFFFWFFCYCCCFSANFPWTGTASLLSFLNWICMSILLLSLPSSQPFFFIFQSPSLRFLYVSLALLKCHSLWCRLLGTRSILWPVQRFSFALSLFIYIFNVCGIRCAWAHTFWHQN